MEMQRDNGGNGQPIWQPWPVNWSAVWVGALAAIVLALIIGLVGIALGAHLLGPSHRVVSWHDYGVAAVIFSIVGAFFSFVVGGWVAARIAGIRSSEPAMLHGCIAWLVAVPLLMVLMALGAGNYFGGWFGGLSGSPAWTVASASGALDSDAAVVARNSALGAVSALLLGLIGSVLGGWMASGEPMTFSHRRTHAGVTGAYPPTARAQV